MSAAVKNPLKATIVVSILGWVNSLYTLIHRQGLFAHGLEEESFCHIGSKFNCDAVALSSYSSFMGLPVSTFGMFFYSFMLITALWAYFMAQDGKKEKTSAAAIILFAMASIALIPTFALAGVSLFVIKSICLMCVLTYILNILLFFCALKIKRHAEEPPGSMRLAKAVSSIPQTLWIVFAIVMGVQLLSPKIVESSVSNGPAIDDETIRAYVTRNLQSPPKAITTEGYPSMGPANAPVTIVDFSDFQCPHCRHASMTLPPLILPYGNKVRFVFKDYPLDSACNPAPGLSAGGHPMACIAAKTGHCVFKLKGNDAFFSYADEIFANQEHLTPEMIEKSGIDRGIPGGKLKECVEDFATHQAIVEEGNEGNGLGIEGTPAIYVNGRFVETGAMPKVLKPIIDSYLGSK